jgi:hypothetical protein
MENTGSLELRRTFFFPVCNKAETDRILNPASGRDYLLKLRAETIVDHMRLFRVYRNKALAREGDWSLEDSFDATHYRAYLDSLSAGDQAKCQEVTYGNMFSNDPNGAIFMSPYGPLLTISEALQFFLEFAHLALLAFDCGVPLHVRGNALRIAVRVMLKTEALDFLVDPRGIVPDSVSRAIRAPIHLQMQYIAGHEFAHYILGHVSEERVTESPVFHAITPRDSNYGSVRLFSQTQQEELDADVAAIELVRQNPVHATALLDSALLWFSLLDLYEAVASTLYPASPWVLRSHPTARVRLEHLLTNARKPASFDMGRWARLAQTVEILKRWLVDDVTANTDGYEGYGSVYLDEPNTKWRGRKWIDRVDYY